VPAANMISVEAELAGSAEKAKNEEVVLHPENKG
jgi:hypothetical protein